MTNIKTSIENLPDSQVIIRGSFEFSEIENVKKRVVEDIQKDFEMPGFRKGHVPEEIIIKKYGEQPILEESARTVLDREYPKIIEENKLKVIGRPKVALTKLASGNPVEFSITVPILPSFSLPEYKSIAQKQILFEKQQTPTKEEIDDLILQIRRNKAHNDIHKKGEKHEHEREVPESELPLLTDELVKEFGDFSDIADFEKKVEENIFDAKKIQAEEKWRASLFDRLVSDTAIDVPEVLIESELEKMLAQFEGEITQAGMPFDDYLKTIKKTIDDIKKDWRSTAEKKAKLQLILNAIAEEEKIRPDEEQIRTETEKILIIHKDADPIRARLYVAQMMLNQEVIKFLDTLRTTDEK